MGTKKAVKRPGYNVDFLHFVEANNLVFQETTP